MSVDPRDQALETLLRTSRAQVAEPSADCLDADTIAAWVDGGLDANALRRAETHVADCARCQAVMATLARSSEEPAPVLQDSGTVKPWWQLNLRWLVPLAGAATAALLWAVVPSGPPSQVPDPAAPPPMAVAEAPAPPSQNPSDTRERDLPPATPQAPRALEKSESARAGQRVWRADAQEMQARAEPAPRAKAEAPPEKPAEAKVTAPESSAAERPAPAATAAAPAIAGAARDADAARDRAAFAQAAPVVAWRDASGRWRVRGDGVIERSADNGTTWAAAGRAEGAVLAGGSPAADICWLAGRGGLVMLTADGRTWRRLPAPTTDDLVAVEAIDAREATVRTADGRAYRTTDSGATWQGTVP